jgi:hypothetical protein
MSKSKAARIVPSRNTNSMHDIVYDIDSTVLQGTTRLAWCASTLTFGMPNLAPAAFGGNKVFATRKAAEAAVDKAVAAFNIASSLAAPSHMKDSQYFVRATHEQSEDQKFQRAKEDGGIIRWVPTDSRFQSTGMDGPICIRPIEIIS